MKVECWRCSKFLYDDGWEPKRTGSGTLYDKIFWDVPIRAPIFCSDDCMGSYVIKTTKEFSEMLGHKWLKEAKNEQ